MCGILGGIGLSIDSVALESSLGYLIHRGPDHQGFKSFKGNCYMGVARLAMTDPHPRSNQPLISKDGKFAISFNGEIYNYADLREELESENVEFVTKSDTEVLLHVFQKEGIQSLSRLEGMFAFAIYDLENQRVTIARDKLGKKPLYFADKDGCLYWSSSLKVISDLVSSRDKTEIPNLNFLSLGYQLDPSTGYDGIYSLLPGHFLEYELPTTSAIPIKFPKSSQRKPVPTSLRKALLKAIEVRVQGHQKIGLSLSGGMDSTILAIGLRELGIKADTFSAYWSNSDKARYNSDAEHAKEIANLLDHEHHPVDISEDFQLARVLRDYLIAMEEPNNNPSGLSTLALYRAVAGEEIRLILTGDGSDEIFGGYARHSLATKFPRVLKLKSSKLDGQLFCRNTRFDKMLSNLIASQISPSSSKFWLHWHLVFTPSELSRLFNREVTSNSITEYLTNEIEILSPRDEKNIASQSLMKRDHEIWLSMESNRKLDRISMSFSIEARSPFQDENVINFANLAMARNGFRELNKKILRNEFPEIDNIPVKKEKVGFTSPVGHWMREDPNFINESLEFLCEQREFNVKRLETFKNAQFRGDYRTNMQLWTLVVYANWIKLKNGTFE